MKPFIFGLAVLAAGLSSSVASAYPYTDQRCCGRPSCPTFCEAGYNGFYIGGNLGVISYLALCNEDDNLGLKGKYYTDTGFTAGGQTGYDWNWGCPLLGVVADWDWSNIHQSHTALTGDLLKDKLDWYLTIRGRAGVTVCDCLFYLTAGAALGGFETTWRADGGSEIFHKNASQWGWTGGFGVEYLLGYNWSLGADLLFMYFGYDKKAFTRTDGGIDVLGTNHAVWVARMILNYHFGDLFDCCYR